MRKWSRMWRHLSFGLIVLGGVYVALAWWSGRQIPSSAVVEGVTIGGLSREEAADRLAGDLSPQAAMPLTIEVREVGTDFIVDPATAGLALDIPATLDDLTSFTLDPTRVWARLAGGIDRPVQTTVDRDKLAADLANKARDVGRAPIDGSVSFIDGQVSTTPPEPGVQVEVDALVDTISTGWPSRTTITAPVTRIAPEVGQDAVDTVVRDFAVPAASGPVTLVVAEQSIPITPEQFAPALSIEPDGAGGLSPTVDEQRLSEVILAASESVVVPAQDAAIVLEGGRPVVRPSVDGVTVDTSGLGPSFTTALTSSDRRLEVSATVTKPEFTTEQATALGVQEVVASFDSSFPNKRARTANLDLASRTISGTLIKPGETFSMNGILGERTPAKGYREAGIIVNNRLAKSTGGGISQVSTVIFNLAWFSGVQIEEFHPHSFYISRYPVGREATINWPNLDNRWTNNTPYGILVQLWVADGQVHGRMWSTKHFDVESITGSRINHQPSGRVTLTTPGCVPQSGIDGFDVTIQRIVRQGGAVVEDKSYPIHYQAADRVICQ